MGMGFFLKDAKAEKSAIVAIVRFKGQRYKIYTGESVKVAFWLDGKAATGRKYPEGAFINDKLAVVEADMKGVVNFFNLSNMVPTTQEFKRKYEEMIGKDVGNDYFTDYVAAQIEKEKRFKSELTTKKYVTALGKLRDYERTHGRLKFSDINIDFYRSFKGWFYKEKFSRNYFGTMIKEIKKFMNGSIKDGLHNFTGHKHPDFKTDQEDADTIYLTNEELDRIYNIEFTKELMEEEYGDMTNGNLVRRIEALNRSRDRFLIGCYSLLRVSDYKRLSEINIKEGYIKIKPKKRSKGRINRDVYIPLHSRVVELLERGVDLEATASEVKINKHIKEVCRMCGIRDKVVVAKTVQDKEVEEVYEKWQLVSTHTARRTAATNMLLAGMEASDIMMLGNWSSERSFWKYIRMKPELNAKRLAQHAYFGEGK